MRFDFNAYSRQLGQHSCQKGPVSKPIRYKSNISSPFRRTLTPDYSSFEQIFSTQAVILPLQVLGWLSTARFDQGFYEEESSAQPLPPTHVEAGAVKLKVRKPRLQQNS